MQPRTSAAHGGIEMNATRLRRQKPLTALWPPVWLTPLHSVQMMMP